MCGIVGIWNFAREEKGMSHLLMKMANRLRHRGPDDEGYLLANTLSGRALLLGGEDTRKELELPMLNQNRNGSFDLGLGFRRLSILDLSSAGHQPMGNERGNIWIVYNGEVYNYREIRKDLELRGHRFRSNTDSEVVLHAYEEWGTDCLPRFNGMWALAIMDLKTRRLFCARDRAGVKPFYYSYDGKRFCFASEIKALLALEDLPVKPNDQVIADYLFLGLQDHTGETFFEKVSQLAPGESLLLQDGNMTTRSYWDLEPRQVRFVREEDYAHRFRELFEDSIRLRLRSDVPIGSCLSGGLDSSSIVCLANRMMRDGGTIDPELVGEKQKTFSSCFENPDYDERVFIEKVIEQTGAEENFVFPALEDLSAGMRDLVWQQDEPFGSTSIYAQWTVMKRARDRGVTVLLDGQGGDELLAGYLPSFYALLSQKLMSADLWGLLKEVRGFRGIDANLERSWLKGTVYSMVPDRMKAVLRKTVKPGIEWGRADFRKRYLRALPGTSKFEHPVDNYLYDIFRWRSLPGLLHYEDRNSMAFSLETRLPFLDYRLVEYAFSLPVEQKIRDGTTKVVLRNAMEGILPEPVRTRRDKMGFVTPEEIWFKTVLRNQIRDILRSESFGDRGYFDVARVENAFDDHCKGKKNLSPIIWRWVNLELWFRLFVDQRPALAA
jgi:asparagine synthase (glutamine-hydrolysing)